jgi:hypothetical protein
VTRKKIEKKVGINTFKVSLPDHEKMLLRVMSVKTKLPMSEVLRRAILALDLFYQINGHHLFEDPIYDPVPPIAEILTNLGIQTLGEKTHLPNERIEALVAGDRPTDGELSLLAMADCVPYTLPQLSRSRQLQFNNEELKNVSS